MQEKSKPIVWKSVFCVLPCSLVFLFTRLLLGLLVGFVGVLLQNIPIVGKILNFMLIQRGENMLMFSIVTSVFFAYLITSYLQNKMMKDRYTNRLSRRILGIIIVLLHILSFASNFMHGESVFPNIMCFIAGLVFIFKNEKDSLDNYEN